MPEVTFNALVHNLPAEQWYTLLQAEEVPKTLVEICARYPFCPRLLLDYARLACSEHAATGALIARHLIITASDPTTKNFASLESLAQVTTPTIQSSRSESTTPAASTVLQALRHLASQATPHYSLLEIMQLALQSVQLTPDLPVEEANLALSMAVWATTEPRAQPIANALKALLAQSGGISTTGRRSPAKKFNALPDTSLQSPVDRLALVLSQGPSPAAWLLLSHIPWCPNRTDQLQTILALRGWQRLSGAQQVTERKSLLFECLYICASLPESVLAGSIKHYVGAQLSVLYNKGHSRHSVTEEWTKSATDVMQLEFPQKAAAEELLKTWSLRVTSPESSAPHHMLESAQTILAAGNTDACMREEIKPRVILDNDGHIASVVIEALERYAHTPGHAQAFATVCKAIFSDDDILQCVLFNCDLHQLLSPLQHYVDNFKSDDEFASGDGSAFEAFGSATTLLLVIAAWVPDTPRLPEGSDSVGFASIWLRSMSQRHSMNYLLKGDAQLVGRWLSALFSDGIADELISHTSPRSLLQLAPTIVGQAVQACQLGVIDLDTLKEGVSYFTQDLLNFTIPGIILSLITDLQGSEARRSIVLHVFHRFFCASSSSLPPTLLALIAPSIQKIIPSLPSPNDMTNEIEQAMQPHLSSQNRPAGAGATLDPVHLASLLQEFIMSSSQLPQGAGTKLSEAVYLATLLDQAFIVFEPLRLAQLLLNTTLDLWSSTVDNGQKDRILEWGSTLLLWSPSKSTFHPWPLLAVAAAEARKPSLQELLDPKKLQAHAQILRMGIAGAQAQAETGGHRGQQVAAQALRRKLGQEEEGEES